MKSHEASAKNLSALLRRLGKPATAACPDAADPVAVLIQSFFLWESTTDEAIAAYAAMKKQFVDYNELRVSLPYEVVGHLGLRDRRALDRCQRLRAVLTDLFKREHEVTMKRLPMLGKREVRKYLDELEGMVPYVAARLSLLCFDTHSIPVDDRLRDLLIQEGIADPAMDVNELSAWVSRHVKAGQGPHVHRALQAWGDRVTERLAGDGAPSKRRPAPKRARTVARKSPRASRGVHKA